MAAVVAAVLALLPAARGVKVLQRAAAIIARFIPGGTAALARIAARIEALVAMSDTIVEVLTLLRDLYECYGGQTATGGSDGNQAGSA